MLVSFSLKKLKVFTSKKKVAISENASVWYDFVAHGSKLVTTLVTTSRAARGGGGSFKIRKRIGEIGCCESRMTEQKHWWIELSNRVTD